MLHMYMRCSPKQLSFCRTLGIARRPGNFSARAPCQLPPSYACCAKTVIGMRQVRTLRVSSTPRAASLREKTRSLRALPATFYRGGTSKGLIIHRKNLPVDRSEWDSIFLSCMGSPDPNGRQLDGMGGGYASVSKVCVVGPVEAKMAKDVDVQFTFVQVGVKNTMVDYASNCGNLSAAIGPWALENGFPFTEDSEGSACVRIFNTNTSKTIHSYFPVEREAGRIRPAADGDFAIDGVSSTSSRIKLDFISPGGSKTGKLLPTGNVTDIMTAIPHLSSSNLPVSLIDCGNPCVFLKTEDLVFSDASGIKTTIEGGILPDDMHAHPYLLTTLEEVRIQASLMMGLTRSRQEAIDQKSIPKVCFVSPSQPHTLLSGEKVGPEDTSKSDLLVRTISTGDPHRALPITVSLCVAAAGRVKGSVVQSVLRTDGTQADEQGIVIAHPSGRLTVGADVKVEDNGNVLVRAGTIYRTARKLFEGQAFYVA